MRLREPLTYVTTEFADGKHNYRRLFGRPVSVRTLADHVGLTTEVEAYEPGQVFGLDVWDCNEYGTTRWHIYVCRAAAPGEVARVVPQVEPGAVVLLDAVGVHQSQVVIAWLADLEASGDPSALPSEFFEARDFLLKGTRPKYLTKDLLHRRQP